MDSNMVSKKLIVKGMTCANCELRIENKLKKLPGVIAVSVTYAGQQVNVTFDRSKVSIAEVINVVEKMDYQVASIADINKKGQQTEKEKSDITYILGLGMILFAAYLFIQNTVGFNFIPEVNQNMGYSILFVVGMLTSVHCIAMCGGINLSQCISCKSAQQSGFAKLKPSLLYNAGRVVSYTVIGAIVGAIGSVISISGTAKGLVSVAAGVFMLIMGLNMLNIFPGLRKLTPKMPKLFGNKIYNNEGKYGPFVIGLLNGLMPCGPLQSMQIYALGTGSAVTGALSMFLFSLGTVPLMFGFGAISSMLSSKFTDKMMKVSAALVMVLGVVMLNRGISLSGLDVSAALLPTENSAVAIPDTNTAQVTPEVQYITSTMSRRSYEPITVQKGVPVKWTLQVDAQNLNGCNNAIYIPEYGIEMRLQPGDNLIEFTPGQSGTIPFSCWMGMIRSKITIVDQLEPSDQSVAAAQQPVTAQSLPAETAKQPESVAPGNGILTDTVAVATDVDGVQQVTVTLGNDGFKPGVLVIEKDKEFVIKFEQDGYDGFVYFPELQGGVDLAYESETPPLTVSANFTFEDEYGLNRVFVKMVDDIETADVEAAKADAEKYFPLITGGCCD